MPAVSNLNVVLMLFNSFFFFLLSLSFFLVAVTQLVLKKIEIALHIINYKYGGKQA